MEETRSLLLLGVDGHGTPVKSLQICLLFASMLCKFGFEFPLTSDPSQVCRCFKRSVSVILSDYTYNFFETISKLPYTSRNLHPLKFPIEAKRISWYKKVELAPREKEESTGELLDGSRHAR